MKPQNCVALEPRPLPVCVITSNLEGNQNWEHLGPAPCGRVVGDLYTSPHMCYLAEVCRSMSNGTSVIKEIHLKKNDSWYPAFPGHSRSSDRHGSIRHRWLPFHEPSLYRLQDKRRFQSKIAKKNCNTGVWLWCCDTQQTETTCFAFIGFFFTYYSLMNIHCIQDLFALHRLLFTPLHLLCIHRWQLQLLTYYNDSVTNYVG